MTSIARTVRERSRCHGVGALALLCTGLAACGEAPSSAPSLTESTGLTDHEGRAARAPFTVRGRWPQGHTLLYAIEEEGGPLTSVDFRGALEQALSTWRDCTIAKFAPVPAGAQADVTFGMRSGDHGTCPPFGGDGRVAHTGPVEHGTFVHFDAERPWRPRSDVADSLYHVALHEIGHVLGLGHSPDPRAVMCADFAGDADEPTLSDRAGIASLYGRLAGPLAGPLAGDVPLAPADLSIRSQGEEVARLYRVAPAGTSDFAVVDTDGDGEQEVVIWRTDAAGHGAVMVFHFTRGCLLERSVGPLMGMVLPGVPVRCGWTRDGRCVLVSASPSGAVVARAFESSGGMGSASGVEAGIELVNPDGPRAGDLDGDGVVEAVMNRSY